MKGNKVKRTLAAGGISVGTMVFEFKTPGIARIAAEAGADFAVFDMEHTGWNEETIGMLVATGRGAEIVPIVRIPAIQYHRIARVLDVGVMGVMAPMVETEEQARLLVASAKYPPRGKRGAAFGIAHDDFKSGADILETMRNANDEGLIIAQIETEREGGRDHDGERGKRSRPARPGLSLSRVLGRPLDLRSGAPAGDPGYSGWRVIA